MPMKAFTKPKLTVPEAVSGVIEISTDLLNDYRNREELAREISAQEALEKAQADAEQQKEVDLLCLDEAIAALEDADPVKAKAVSDEANALRDAPAPIFAVMDDGPGHVEPTPLIERVRYSTEKQVDIIKLAEAVVKGYVSPNALLPNRVWLDGQARSLHEEFSIPGVSLRVGRFYARKGGAS